MSYTLVILFPGNKSIYECSLGSNCILKKAESGRLFNLGAKISSLVLKVVGHRSGGLVLSKASPWKP
ncbi:hypothetical protein KC332_g10194 [Hortaea werneckii]|uniref:Uncharacterized protein n=2 Tax=Hortaea werneckii TaxID=91943 RepID=A0A3M7GZV8_HORWE|nr:hypothetical protein KC358_g10068 [Hortaea werneckii]OTA38538.1 hypothetical protein BTJ68_01651 [Hortaea werneckii EXF-2000]KAI6822979.1 hypothetical protein KC350_g9296 [Hortaea werneckii]KAI6916603.1 hypothetical protein KC348_g11484 [Hortaea werneckii]KAI6931137.1 hypothetical protein KC341_g9798 [Hortaea werneckii]